MYTILGSVAAGQGRAGWGGDLSRRRITGGNHGRVCTAASPGKHDRHSQTMIRLRRSQHLLHQIHRDHSAKIIHGANRGATTRLSLLWLCDEYKTANPTGAVGFSWGCALLCLPNLNFSIFTP